MICILRKVSLRTGSIELGVAEVHLCCEIVGVLVLDWSRSWSVENNQRPSSSDKADCHLNKQTVSKHPKIVTITYH
jgi:hypothetical protein